MNHERSLTNQNTCNPCEGLWKIQKHITHVGSSTNHIIYKLLTKKPFAMNDQPLRGIWGHKAKGHDDPYSPIDVIW